MSSPKQYLVLAVQLAVSAGLMVFVCSRIQLDDVVRLGSGETLVGRIVGHTPEGDLRFRLGSGEERRIEHATIEHRDGHVVGLTPGFVTTVARVDPFLVAMGFLSLVGGYGVSVVRWWLLLVKQGVIVGLGQVFRWTYIGIFFNNVMLGSTGGDVIKALYVARECKDRTRAVVSVFVDRAIGMLSLAMLAGIVTTPFASEPAFREAAIFIYCLLGAAVIGSMVYFSRRIRRTLRVDWFLSRLPLEGTLREIDQAVMIYRAHKGVVGIAILMSLVGHSLLVTSTLLLGRALGIDLPSATYFIFTPVILILTALPITVQGWGLGEMIWVYALAKVGVAGEMALSLSLANRLAVMIFSLGGGLCMLQSGKPPATDADAPSSGSEGAPSGP